MEEEKGKTEEGGEEQARIEEAPREEVVTELEREIENQKDKYLRLYSDFETYKRRAAKDREELCRFANEEIVKELLPSLDNLETALKHALEAGAAGDGLKQGVEMTLRELKRTLEKFGLKSIDALGEPFDPEFHHAISQVERDDVPEKTVVEELRKGYTFNDKVIRASLVGVSKKPEQKEKSPEEIDIKIQK
jgi:molecular chaperone GrpE